MLQRLFSVPNAGGGGSFKAAVSVLGHPVVGITLPSGILMYVLCCQTASSTFPPHIFLSLLLFCSLCHPKPSPPLSSLALSTAVHSNTHRQMRPPPHTHIFFVSVLSGAKLVPLSLSVVFFQLYLLFHVLQQRIFVQMGKRKEGDDCQRRRQMHSECNS